MSKPHVVVIGAGFAGLVAARELESVGISAEIIEARDRVGGRAWTEERMGRPLELGATWVHWFQAHVWHEVVRYNQQIVASPEPKQVYWATKDGKVTEGDLDLMDKTLAEPMAEIFARSEEYFPQPFDPLRILSDEFEGDTSLREQFLADDNKSVIDILEESGKFSQEQIDLANAYWAGGYIGDPSTGSSLMAKQWAAMSDNNLRLVDDITLKFKLVNGMAGIYEAMAADLSCPLRLNTAVTKVEHSATGATVTLANGETIEADAVINTVPVGAIEKIEYSPALPQKVQQVVDEKWNTEGAKIWIKLKGKHEILCYAPANFPISIVRSEYFEDDDTTICVGFGSNHANIDLNSKEEAQKVIDTWRPDIEVVDAAGHDWADDEWSGQAWGTLRKGQFCNGWNNFNETDTRMFFAGTEYAKGWRGVCVDGALETGLTAARKVIKELKG